MAKQVSVLSIFVASPSDMTDERECLEEVIRELNLQWTQSRGIRLELIRWETNVYPGVASDPQEVINDQIGDEYDIFLGLLWKRFGTSTPRASSGTEEEFNRALSRYHKDNKSLRIMIYFKTAGVNLSEIDPNELIRIRQFKSTLGSKGTLYWDFDGADEFSSLMRIHLSRCVEDWGKKWGTGVTTAEIENIPAPLSAAQESDDEGFIDLIEMVMQNFEQLKEQAEHIAESTATLGKKINERTREFNECKGNGSNVNLNVVKRICNLAADNLETYATTMDAAVPIFASKFKVGINSYARAASILPDFSSGNNDVGRQLDDAIRAASELRTSLDESAKSTGEFRQSIAHSPRMTTQYNRSKRHALTILDRFLAELESGKGRLSECQKLLGAMRAEIPTKIHKGSKKRKGTVL